MKKLLLLLSAIMMALSSYSAESSYSIEISSTAKGATQISTSTKATTFIGQDSRQYVATSPVQSATNTYYGGTTASEKSSIRIGTKSAAGKITLTLSESGKVNATSITISAKKYTSTENATDVEINGKTINVSSADFADYTVALDGSLVETIAISTLGKDTNRVYVQSITVNYSDVVELGALSATCEGLAVGSTLEVYEGEPIVFHADNATSIEVVPENVGELTFDAATSSATLIPAICDNVKVSAVAKLEVEGEETKVSDPLEFDLTVKKADYVIADWVVTGITSTSGGSKLDNPLICSESSAAGTWQANHATAYSATTNGCAQLGSSTAANTFNGGTLTLSKSDIPADATILSVSMTGYNNNSTHAVWTVSVDEVEAASKITFGNSSATNTVNVNLVGNKIVLTCNASTANGNIKQVYLSGISVKYVLPEEQPGEIALDYTKQFCLECDETGTELTVMDGTELTFSSFAAARMEITTEDEGVVLPSAVNEANISWTVPEGTIATIK